ncbi:hypothetical protein [Aquimarina aquimarini]|uniref:hypothetical protein n=1 Tax=Aquimarina aquimarini TaxID=1191734 RepID=UPI000D54F215|nr:hypothetical protein [Aquimarina aquimarini]
MEYINILRRIFDEDMRYLNFNYFKTTYYQTYLKTEHSKLQTYYLLKIKKDNNGSCSILSHTETPFHPGFSHLTKKKRKNILSEISDCTLNNFLLKNFSGNEITLNYVFLKEKIQCSSDPTQEYLTLELYATLCIETIEAETLCYYYYYKLMEDIRQGFTRYLEDLYFDEKKTEQKRSILIRKYQHQLGNYLSDLELRFNSDSSCINIEEISLNKTVCDVFKCIYLRLEEILLFLERSCYDYIDKQKEIPYLQRKRFIDQYYDTSKKLITLIKNQKLPKEIEVSVCKPLKAILESNLTSFSYLRREYYRKYIDVFTLLLQKLKTPNHDQIYKLLIALDYNNHNIYKAMEWEMINEMDMYDQKIEKKKYLYTRLAQIKQIAVTSPFKYNLEFPGLKEYLILWITQMIDLVDRQMELEEFHQLQVQHPILKKGDSSRPVIQKRRVNITVHEIALLARLFYETGVISIESSKQRYFRFLSNTYNTKKEDTISEHTIKNSFYTPKIESYKPIEELLIRMITKLNKIKGNCSLNNKI